MPHVEEKAKLSRSADAAWAEIGGFGAVGDWHPMLERVESEGDTPGSRRVAHAADGGTQVERLEAYDSDRHVYRYVIEKTAMPIRDYSAAFRIDEEGPNESSVTWTARFQVVGDDESGGVNLIRQFLKAGTKALERRYGP